jgi:predicted acyltransferase
MSESASARFAPGRERLRSVDVFRGCAVIAMMLVDWTGSWDTRRAIFDHAAWLGITPPDFIFPALLFIAGVAIPLSLSRVRREGPTTAVYVRIVRRAVLLFALGLLLNVFWDWSPGFDLWGKTRLMGVLQRYALVYPVAALLYLKVSVRAMVILGGAVLLGYWAAMTLIPVPGFGPPDLTLVPGANGVAPNLATWIDKIILGARAGVFYPHDPEGLLPTLPALVTVIIGVAAGQWLLQEIPTEQKILRLFLWGVGLAIAGYLWGQGFPLSKKLWTSSFVLLMAGASLLLLAVFVQLIDLGGTARFTALPLYYGSNALGAIVLFTSIDNLLGQIPLAHAADGTTYSVKKFIYERGLASWLPAKDAAWVYSVIGITLLGLLFRALYRRRVFIRL